MKTIQIEIPDGKCAQWVNGVLTLVEENKVDNRPVTERIKTLGNAVDALGTDHPAVNDYAKITSRLDGMKMPTDIIAYLKLRIIAAALNEGWTPQFTKGEYRYFPWLYLYTQEGYDKLTDEEKSRCVSRSGNNATYGNAGIVYVYASYAAARSYGNYGSRLAFRTRELAEYAGRQFASIWADFIFGLEDKVSGDAVCNCKATNI